jgi:inosine-uridine nucleoside N-ribohydrolase
MNDRNCRAGMFCLLLVLGCATTAGSEEPSSARTPILLDTDLGDDVDDAFALALAANSPEFDLRGVTTVGKDGRTRAMIACRFLHAIGKAKIPVAAGASRVRSPSTDGQFQYGLRPARTFPVRTPAVEALYRQLKAEPGRLTIVAVGPLTNIAELLRKHPDCKPWIKRVVVMGGSVRVGYKGKPPAEVEWNIKSDVKAAQAVFASGVPLTVAPLDATTNLKLDKSARDTLFSTGTAVTNELWTLYDLWNKPTPVLYDPVSVTLCFTERFCTMENLRLTVDDKGMTRTVKGNPNCRVATAVKRDDILKWCVKRITGDRVVVGVHRDGTLEFGQRPVTRAALNAILKKRAGKNGTLRIVLRAGATTPGGRVTDAIAGLQAAGFPHFDLQVNREQKEQQHVVKPLTDNRLSRRVHVVEDYETDIERRWWLAGRLETKDVPPARSKSVPNRRCCRGTLTKIFDARMGDQTRLYRAVIFNPVPGPPMGPKTRLAFRYRIKGSGTLKVQVYTLSKGYHRFLTLTGLPQDKWQAAVVDMTKARRPDGSGGPLSENERIDDIQFYTSPHAELLIDDIVLYDAAPDSETRPFPKRIVFTGWFDTGKQGNEWPGDFEIVPHQKPLAWKAAASVANKSSGKPWIRTSLRGRRTLSRATAVRFRYHFTGKGSLQVGFADGKRTPRPPALPLQPVTGRWTEATLRFAFPARSFSKLPAADAIRFQVDDKAGRLSIDDLLIVEP